MSLLTRTRTAAMAAVAVAFVTAGCTTDAARVDENLKVAADNFEVNRRIVGINGITDEVLFSIEGRCSITRDGDLVVLCKIGPDAYEKHMLGLSDNVTFISTQMGPIDADPYHSRVIFKPQNIVPDVDLSVGKR